MAQSAPLVHALCSAAAIATAFRTDLGSGLAAVALLPLLGALNRCRPATAIVAGGCCGLAAHVLACPWLWAALAGRANIAPSAALAWLLVFALAQAWTIACFAGLACHVRHRARPAALGVPLVAVAWVVAEDLPLRPIPWNLGAALAGLPLGRWLISAIGVDGASAACVGFATTLAWSLPGAWLRRGSLAIGGFATGLVLGTTNAGTAEPSPAPNRGITFLVVQSGSASSPGGVQRAWIDLTRATERALRRHARPDLIVWPETALPLSPRHAPAWRRRIEARVRHWRAPLLFGAVESTGDGGSERNVAFLVQQSSGAMRWQLVRKHALVPWVETPFTGPWPRKSRAEPRAAPFQAGEAAPPLILQTRAGSLRLGVAICYEAVASDLWAQHVAADADVLIQLADDRWLGPDGARQHLLLVQAQAASLRRWVVRASGSGPSAFVDPTGAVVARTSFGRPAVTTSTLPVAPRVALPRTAPPEEAS